MFFRKEKSNMDFLIVGLGNPGSQYDKTRHNVGFNAIDYLSGKTGIEVKKLKHMAKVGTGRIEDMKVMLIKPQTFMNSSGQAVADAASYYGVKPEHIIVIYDDISLDVGRMRIRRSGSAGGHNGIKSLIEYLKTDSFPRIKIGVGAKPNPEYDLADWVLSDLSPKERGLIADKYDCIYDSICLIIKGKTEEAMQKYN